MTTSIGRCLVLKMCLGPHNDQIVWSLCGPGRCLVLLHRGGPVGLGAKALTSVTSLRRTKSHSDAQKCAGKDSFCERADMHKMIDVTASTSVKFWHDQTTTQ